jgi:hypothetical protein
MFNIHDYERARLLYADPQNFIDAAKLLAALLAQLTAYPMGDRVMFYGHVKPEMMEHLATWGAELDDLEQDDDLEEEPDREPRDYADGVYNEVIS